ncbi:MAG: tRNA (adenosine(37)-N6)-threonylcarbamoyltransferase complex dimerization subunit type 1 TsaB [Treponema sp.]|nr:tRNA (adenosine(37)-N6)-threonylcarbamoyltransferase complex dimerization subunit type 1 TsaB [Treponema sp.]
MNILAIDTATAVLAVAVASHDAVRYMEFDAGPAHAETLMPMVDWLIRCSGMNREDLQMTACMRGPGSFTGLRIGFATAKGLAAALGIPMVSAPTLDCLAAPYSLWPGLVVPVIDAKKQRFFTALYQKHKRLTGYLDATAQELAAAIHGAPELPGASGGAPVLLTGPDAPAAKYALEGLLGKDRVVIDPAYRRSKCRELLEYSRHWSIVANNNGGADGPLYIRKSDAELKAGI